MPDIQIGPNDALWVLGELFKLNPTAQLQVTNLILGRRLAESEAKVAELSKSPNGVASVGVPAISVLPNAP